MGFVLPEASTSVKVIPVIINDDNEPVKLKLNDDVAVPDLIVNVLKAASFIHTKDIFDVIFKLVPDFTETVGAPLEGFIIKELTFIFV